MEEEKTWEDTEETKTEDRRKMQKPEKPVSVLREVISWILTIGAAVLIAIGLNRFVLINAEIPSGSMENTIMTGDKIIGFRLAYAFSEPDRGDIIIFRNPDNESENYVKRVIGLPGETVVIEEGKIYIDGDLLQEDYLKEDWILATGPYRFEVPEGAYLVLGDNRNNSYDARYWQNTYVSEDKILGKALFRYWPLSDFGGLK